MNVFVVPANPGKKVGKGQNHHAEWTRMLEEAYGGWFVDIRYHGGGVFSGKPRCYTPTSPHQVVKGPRIGLTYLVYLQRTGKKLSPALKEKGFGKDGECGICLASDALHPF